MNLGESVKDYEMQQRALERVKYAVKTMIGDDFVASVEPLMMETYREEMLAASAVTLIKEIWAERLEPEVQRVSFTREVDVHHMRSWAYRMPATWWDHWKWQHRFSWYAQCFRKARWVQAGPPPRELVEPVEVTIDEDVTIERLMTYPDPKIALPTQTMGAYVYKERRTW